jgi:hypothetical protein
MATLKMPDLGWPLLARMTGRCWDRVTPSNYTTTAPLPIEELAVNISHSLNETVLPIDQLATNTTEASNETVRMIPQTKLTVFPIPVETFMKSGPPAVNNTWAEAMKPFLP